MTTNRQKWSYIPKCVHFFCRPPPLSNDVPLVGLAVLATPVDRLKMNGKIEGQFCQHILVLTSTLQHTPRWILPEVELLAILPTTAQSEYHPWFFLTGPLCLYIVSTLSEGDGN